MRKIYIAIENMMLKSSSESVINTFLIIVRKIRKIRYKIPTFLFSKKMKYYCPCCGIKLFTFIPGVYKQHPEMFNLSCYKIPNQNVLCPVCHSLPRHRILAMWCEKRKEELKTRKILYFAPEYSMMRWMKRNHVFCTTADLYAKADLKLDIQKTEIPDKSYDFIFCNHVLEHVDDFRLALKEIYRILNKNGHFICSFPMDQGIDLVEEDPTITTPEERIQRFGQSDHKRIFGVNAAMLLSEEGFIVERISGEEYPPEILPIVGPADYDMNCLFDCLKVPGKGIKP